jgi:hypothetical protein
MGGHYIQRDCWFSKQFIILYFLAHFCFPIEIHLSKKKSHLYKKLYLITFSSGQHSSQINFVLTRREERPKHMDCKVIPGECVVTQYKLLVADFYFQVCVRRDRGMKITRMRWWKLKGDVSQVFKNRFIVEGSWNEGENVNNM